MLTSWAPYAVPVLGLLGLVAFSSVRDQRNDEFPLQPQSSVAVGWADESSCADCHFEQVELFLQTGHAQTLRTVEDSRSQELLQVFQDSVSEYDQTLRVDLSGRDVDVVSQSGANSRSLELDWCFGSGTHAHTWVGTLPDARGQRDLVEFRWSWYHETASFDITPGQTAQKGSGYFAPLGTLFDTPKARRCFACHSTVLPESNGHVDYNAIHPGVTCQRCHGPRQSHVESNGEIQEGFWQAASQMDSIKRCGECHRIAEDQDPEDIKPENPDIVRFQPVSLVQSPCFKNSPQMTCVSCHNPHRPLNSQNSSGIWQCVQCHDSQQEDHVLCSADQLDNCLECHMPKIQVFENIQFTDHWIRVRKSLPKIPN
jgi:hypothetical protein